MIRVLLADDQSLVRAGFKALLDARDDIEVVGEAPDGAEAVDLARRLRPDVILMDIRMPGLDGLEATRQIAADPELTGARIVILTTFGLDEYLFDALRFGASGFLLKDTEPADLATAVRVVAQGDSLISPSTRRRRPHQRRDRPEAVHEPGHRAHPCQPGHDQTRGTRPRATRRPGLRNGPGAPELAHLTHPCYASRRTRRSVPRARTSTV
jgi:DNA-binding NarL/FixJ family response regulator